MKSKPAVGMLVLLAIGLITWSLTTTIAAGLVGGREQFLEWRADNMMLFYGIWLAEVVVIGLPALWFVGRRMSAVSAQQDEAALAARGVGRLAGKALRGDKKSIEHLVKLLDDGSPAVRYQSARALAMLDDKATDEELFRKIRYWDGDLKLGLIDVLRRTMDMRTVKLLRVLAEDRNPMVARKARTALGIVSSRTRNMDDIVAVRRKQAQEKQQKVARKKAKASGDTPQGAAVATAGDEQAPTDPPAGVETPTTVEAPTKVEAPAKVETPAKVGPPTSVEPPAEVETPATVETPASVEPQD